MTPEQQALLKEWKQAWSDYLMIARLPTDDERRKVYEIDRKCVAAGCFPNRVN